MFWVTPNWLYGSASLTHTHGQNLWKLHHMPDFLHYWNEDQVLYVYSTDFLHPADAGITIRVIS